MARIRIKLEPKKNCKICFGRGYNRIIRQDLDASKYRELRPCTCVKAVVNVKDLEEYEAEHFVA